MARHTHRMAGRRARPWLLAGTLLLATLLTGPTGAVVQAQGPPRTGLRLVNADTALVERKEDGRFIARPVFSQQLAVLFYGVRHPDTGAWLTAMYRVQGGAARRADGWEYPFEYPVLAEQPTLDAEEAYLLVLLAGTASDTAPHTFYAVVPVHQPGGLWDRVLGALDPGRWAKAYARWVIEGVHGAICGVVEHVTGADAALCAGERPA